MRTTRHSSLRNTRNPSRRTAGTVLAVAALTALGNTALANNLLVPSQYPTIQDALDDVRAGDTVVLAPGVYSGTGNEALQMPRVAFTLRGETGDPADVVIEGPYDPTLRIIHAMDFGAGASGSRLEDLTVTGFTGLNGAAIRVRDADLTLDNCVFSSSYVGTLECFENGYGGAFYTWNSTMRFVDCVLRDNAATGVTCSGVGGDGRGGGVWANGGELTFERCLIEGNSVWAGGDSTSDGSGGAVYAPGSAVTLIDSTVRENRSRGGTASGAAISAQSVVAIDTDFIDNYGGGVAWGFETHGAGISATTVLAIGCDFIGNTNVAVEGTAVGAAISGTEVTIINGSIVGNTAGDGFETWNARGGAVHATQSLDMVNVVVADNRALRIDPSFDALGGAVHAQGSATLTGVTFAGNDAATGDAIYAAGGSLELHNSIVSNGAAWLAGPGAVTATWSCIVGGYPGAGNIDADPMLDAGYRPMEGSPVIDAGNTTLLPADAFDLDGDGDLGEPIPFDAAGLTRVVDDPATPDTGVGSPVVDMGAYEVQSVCRADFDGDGALTIFDFLAFQNAFDAGDLAADFDGDGSLTLFDFLAFQNEFAAGCG